MDSLREQCTLGNTCCMLCSAILQGIRENAKYEADSRYHERMTWNSYRVSMTCWAASRAHGTKFWPICFPPLWSQSNTTLSNLCRPLANLAAFDCFISHLSMVCSSWICLPASPSILVDYRIPIPWFCSWIFKGKQPGPPNFQDGCHGFAFKLLTIFSCSFFPKWDMST